jgi:hypothetical protein
MATLHPKENVQAIFTFALGATFYVLTDLQSSNTITDHLWI